VVKRYIRSGIMEFIQGINFHSTSGYKYLISGDTRPSELDADNHIAELLSAQKYSYLLQPGQKFYFVYPVKTHLGNKQVFGSGEIVRSKQPGRETILVPFLQYFAINLSDAFKYSMNFEKFFKENGTNYQEIFSKSQTDLNLTPQKVTVETNETIENNVSEYDVLQECVGYRGSKIKKYVTTLEEGLNDLNNLMLSPNVIRWSFSAILTPLDEEYRENIVIIYGQPSKPQMDPEPPKYVFQLRSENQEDLVERFLAYVIAEKITFPTSVNLAIIDNIDLGEIEELLKKFIKKYSTERPQIKINQEKNRSNLANLIQEVANKQLPIPQDLKNIDLNLNEYEENFKLNCPFLDRNSVNALDISTNEVSKCLANYSGDVLRNIKVSNNKLKEAITTRTQMSSNDISGYWGSSKVIDALITQTDVQGIMADIDFYTSKGVETKALLISQAVSFDKAEKEVEDFSRKVVKLQQSDGIAHLEMLSKGVLFLQEVLVKLQEKLENLKDSPEHYQETEQALISTVKDYVTSYLDWEKRNGELIPESHYTKVLTTVNTLLKIAEGKREKFFEERQQKEQETLKAQKKQIDTQYNDLKETLRVKKNRKR